MEHWGSSGLFSAESKDLSQGQGWPWPTAEGRVGGQRLLFPAKLLTAQPPGSQHGQLHPRIQAELASHQGGAIASDTTCPLDSVSLTPCTRAYLPSPAEL